MQTITELLAQELNCRQEYIANVIALLDEGNTIPFIARYRKEQHGAMDDTTLRTLETRLQYLRNLAQRREEVKASIAAQEKLTDELAKAIDEAATLAEVEDLYRPYKPKRRTRATIAREKGLEPLADAIFAQTLRMDPPEALAAAYIDPDKGVGTLEDALAGASDILAERISDDAEVRKSLRALMHRRGTAQSAAAKEEDEKTAVYRQYFDFSQPISRLQSHQILALNRGEREGALKVSLTVDRDEALQCIRRGVVKPGSPAMDFMKAVCDDSYDRLLEPSMERELRTALTDTANEQAIHNFALNLRPRSCSRRSRARSRWASTPATATAARSRSSTRRARCSTPRSSIPPSAKSRSRTPSRSSLSSSKRTTCAILPSATVPPRARRRRWPLR